MRPDPSAEANLTEDQAPSRRDGWRPARRIARRLLRPVESFLAIEAASGIILLCAALLALGWANSPWSSSYDALWHIPIGATLGKWSFQRDVHFWINDGLMAVFFFVVGLEIRREMHKGELSELRRAAFPLAAAVGGMLAPALIFALLNRGLPSSSGWGVPMATDIAFAVGVLALLGRRVPPALRVLLLALAVIDDVGAILVIAIFYSSGVQLTGFAIAAGGILGIVILQGFRVRSTVAYALPAIVVWAGIYKSGVHPTLAGVLVGLMTPVRALPGERRSPVENLEGQLHGVVAYWIMPLFALANAGVPLSGVAIDGDGALLFSGVTLGLVLGKPLGIAGMAWLANRAGFALRPRGVQWSGVLVVGLVGGIGFTMSLFVADLAFPPGKLLETAKLAVLVASGLAAVLGLGVGRLVLKQSLDPKAARSAHEAETSTEA